MLLQLKRPVSQSQIKICPGLENPLKIQFSFGLALICEASKQNYLCSYGGFILFHTELHHNVLYMTQPKINETKYQIHNITMQWVQVEKIFQEINNIHVSILFQTGVGSSRAPRSLR